MGLTSDGMIFIPKAKGKGKVALCLAKHHAIKMYCGSRFIAPRIIKLGVRRMWVVSFTPQPLYPRGKKLRCPL